MPLPLKDPADGYNWAKVVPLHKLSSALGRGLGGVKILEVKVPESMVVTRSVKEWMNSFVESTESVFKEIHWELTLEGK